jgi:mechanosensitive ion channel-like protein
MPAYSFSTISNWQEAVWIAGANVLSGFFGFLPSFFGALIIFLVGLILAKWGRSLIVKILGAIKLDNLLRKGGLEPFFNKAEIRVKTEVVIGEITHWLIIIVFFMAAINVLGLTTVSGVLSTLLGFLPNIISAVLVLTVGVLLAGFVENLVKGTVNQVDKKTSRLLSKVASYLVVIVASLAAINELGIAQSLINTLFIGVVATLTLGVGLAIGLGAKDLVGQLLTDWYKSQKKEK